ncbi:MAG: Rne/Rng family ribonuclease [Chitinophagales bacterium]|nr:Rne/Rng family ribonuclease [Chitinophagales bacterium]
MEKELIIRNTPGGNEIALLENKKLVELHLEKEENAFKVGDVFLGRVRKIMPGMNAAFVDIGYEKDAFLHYTDLGPGFKTYLQFFKGVLAGNITSINAVKYQSDIDKKGNIKDVLSSKIVLPVQIFKEPISSKGPRLTTELSIAGRYLILTPFNNTIGVSKKIGKEEERERLKILLKSLLPKNFGVIVRTVAQGKGAQELHNDLNKLIQKWELLLVNLKHASYRQKVLSEIDKSSVLVRDLLNDNFKSIVTSDEVLGTDLQEYIAGVAPDKKGIVKVYKGKQPIFDQYDVTRQIKSSFGNTVTFGKGPYLVIEHTEALHVIDVNSGHKMGMSGDQESNALSVNLEAAEEVARQMRLRDIGGIVVVDFIDMKKAENRKEVFDKMREYLKLDKATTNVLPLSKFNLMQITRQRVRPQVEIATKETCPTCGGTGKIESSLLLMDQIKNQVDYLANNNIQFMLMVHPFIASYIKEDFISLLWKWRWEYKQWIKVRANENYGLTEFKFFKANGEEIDLNNLK